MKCAAIIIGRFAFGGWEIFTGTVTVVVLALGLRQGLSSSLSSTPYAVAFGLFGGLLGGMAGALLAFVGLLLERLFKRPASTAAPVNEAIVADPSVWPPAPKLPK